MPKELLARAMEWVLSASLGVSPGGAVTLPLVLLAALWAISAPAEKIRRAIVGVAVLVAAVAALSLASAAPHPVSGPPSASSAVVGVPAQQSAAGQAV